MPAPEIDTYEGLIFAALCDALGDFTWYLDSASVLGMHNLNVFL